MGWLCFESVEVGPQVVDATVRVADPAFARTSAVPTLSPRALELLPGLRRHTCENGSAHGIAAELADTETPHLLEHVAFELMAMAGSPRTLRGETVWDFERDGAGVYHVRLAYDDDLVALGALKSATSVVEWLMDTVAEPDGLTRPDLDAITRGLRVVRSPG